MEISNTQIYYIDSNKRISGSTSQFTYELQINTDYDRCVVLQANIPMSYYLVRDGLNKFTVNENGVSSIITVPKGNYSALSFKNVLAELLNNACDWVYSIELPNSLTESNTAKFRYNVSGNTHQPIFIFDTVTLLHEQMGFNSGTSYEFSGDTLQSVNVVKFVPEDTLFIHSSLVMDNNNDVLQEIYNNNSVQFSNIAYHCNSPDFYSKPIRDNKSKVYTFSLCDETGNVINLNGLNMMITLLLYKRDNINDMIKNYIMYKIQKK